MGYDPNTDGAQIHFFHQIKTRGSIRDPKRKAITGSIWKTPRRREPRGVYGRRPRGPSQAPVESFEQERRRRGKEKQENV
jgi:hypothetical protein